MLTGYKTYITAAVMLILAAGELFGIQVPGFNSDPGTLITAAMGLIFARIGTVKTAS